MHILDTERLTLRTLEADDDAPFYLQLLNEPSFLQYIGDKGVRTLDDARRTIRDGAGAMQKAHGFSMYLVQRRSDGAAIGLCGLIKRDTLPGVDIGYAMSPAYWGQGYAYEAAAAVLAHGRDRIGLTRLLAIASPDNVASIQLLHKLGLSFVERLQLDGAPGGTNLYALDFPPAHT